MAPQTFFITGATGLVGTETVAHLLATTNSTIRVLVRAASTTEAVNRLQALWWGDKLLTEAVGKRVLPMVGDITKERLALDESLLADTTHVVHCAAETGVQKSHRELWKVNVEGTHHVVALAQRMPRLQRFTHISTAYVAGTKSGVIKEDDTLGTSFYSLYEQSKAEAERVVRESSLPFTICRPGMVVGNSQTGRTRNFNTVYYVLKLLLQGKLPLLPISKSQRVNLVPADYVGRLVAQLSLSTDAQGLTFHLVAPYSELPQAGELVEAVGAWAKENLHINMPQPFFVSMPLLRTLGKRHNAPHGEKSRNLFSNLTALMPYFLDDHVFDRTNTTRFAGAYNMPWQQLLPKLLSFACEQNFMRMTDRSIFEQAVIRRASHHYPITYYNITARGTERITGRAMNALVARYANLLRHNGVEPGCRVALSGINCAEHAALDNAIGLCGAVSVPIYYTTPATEIALLIERSGARWFFVGDERIENNLSMVPPEVKIFRFGPLAHDVHKPKQPDKALEQSAQQQTATQTPATFSMDGCATIRYTSGTTGEPKGVMFSFNQLKWLGQVLTNLLSWSDRNSEMRYLSFLPMSHVVEGILAAYAPYCMLCRAKIYYLTDFQMLTKALPRVRPTVFFSVPRFYEKLWEQVELSALGRRYMNLTDGVPKRLLGRMLRWGMLRKAGLDRCSQLLVGSAPVSEELLMRFRALGIEIHNAYGQTEAPLITLNRLGNNVIPSIGTPLPRTKVTTAADGELIVSGPQVALGYYQLQSETFSNGLLHTGDLGSIDAGGHVFIEGRKKDMIITSYGKNINCTKIEQLLTNIDCVEQAVLVGEQRPFCTALLWTIGNTSRLQADIELMNHTLSHPEQVKRWRIISTPLSIKNGELTPNLKVKRQVVTEHYQKEINEMYKP